MSKLSNVGATALSVWSALTLFAGCFVADEGPTADEAVAEAQDELRQVCGGFASLPCPDGQICVDDRTDDCDPPNGGADCSGVCRRTKPPSKKHCHDPARDYVATDPDQCAAVLFLCVEGTQAFFDDCGCGCEVLPTECSPGCGTGEYCAECKTLDGSAFVCIPEGAAC